MYIFTTKGGANYGNHRKKLDEKLVDYLLTAVSTYHSTEIAASVVDHYGDFQRIGRWKQEEMMDDLISKMNDLD